MILLKLLKHIYLTILIFIFLFQSLAGISKTGTTAAQFLKIGVGAREMGMAGAVVASVDNATALYWNTARIAEFKSGNVALSHTNWLVNTDFEYVALTLPATRWGSIGFSATVLDMGDMKVRTVERPEGTGEYFSARDLAFGIGYARRLTDFFSIGFLGKYIRQEIWHCSATSMALDLGTIYHSDNDRIHLGAAVSNFGNKLQYSGKDLRFDHDLDEDTYGDNEHIPARLHTDSWNLPLTFQVGIAVDFPTGEWGVLRLETDAIHPNDNTEHLNIGAEWQINKMFYLNLGYQSLFISKGEQGLTAGLGLRYQIGNLILNANYGYADFGRFAYVDRFDIGLSF